MRTMLLPVVLPLVVVVVVCAVVLTHMPAAPSYDYYCDDCDGDWQCCGASHDYGCESHYYFYTH